MGRLASYNQSDNCYLLIVDAIKGEEYGQIWLDIEVSVIQLVIDCLYTGIYSREVSTGLAAFLRIKIFSKNC